MLVGKFPKPSVLWRVLHSETEERRLHKASLRDTVKDNQEELRASIAWVAFWKTGRSWNAEYFHLEMSDILYPEDRSRMEEIKQADPAAVVVNG